MRLAGFQPLSLLDYPGVICSIIFTQGCAFRCSYCHNPELIPLEGVHQIDEASVWSKLDQHQAMIEGVCVTGGEPTLQADLPDFLQRLKQRRLLVKLDTNGVHPRMVERLIEERLVDYIAMDLKHQWEKYSQIIQIGTPQVIKNCRETFTLIQASSVAHEFRTTVCPGVHTEDDLVAMAGLLKAGEHYSLQEMRREKMFDQSLPDVPGPNLETVAARIREKHPSLEIEVRK